MAKYLVTSGSYFEPFTYDQIAAPVREAAEIHRATQDAYDQYNMEAEALRHYLDTEPEDSEARRMYESYMSKLQNLQNNLWANGYNAQTRRDLAAARAGYASDITRLGSAIQLRQKRSEEWGAYKREHPDAITSEDPGMASLDEYLRNDRYGSDYYTTSGNQLAQDVAADLKARGQELLSNPELMDVNLPGYYFLKTNNGFTNEQVNRAMSAVRAYWSGAGESAFDSLDPVTKVAADTIRYHLDKTGASSRVTAKEFEKALDYAAYGASQGVGKPSIEHLNNLQWEYGMKDWLAEQNDNRAFNNWYRQQMITHPEWFDENGNRVIAEQPQIEESQTPSQFLYTESPEVQKQLTELRKYMGDISPENPIGINTADGLEMVTSWERAAELIYDNEAYRQIRKNFGFDVNIYPDKGKQQYGQITGLVNGVPTVVDVMTDKMSKDDLKLTDEKGRPLFDKDDVAIRQIGKDGVARLDITRTKDYNNARKRNEGYIDEMLNQINKGRDLSAITSKDMSDFKKKHGIDMKVPNNYVSTVIALRSGFGIEKLPTLVGASDTKKQKSYALELLSSGNKNSLKPNSPFAIYKVNTATGAVDYKNPVKSIDQVLFVDNGGELSGNSGSLMTVERLPRDASTGRAEDSLGKLRVTTGKGVFIVDPRMFDSVVADAAMVQKLAGIDDMMAPFNDYSGKIFTETREKSADRLRAAKYHLRFNPPAEFKTMAELLNDPVWRMKYHDALGKYIQTAFDTIDAKKE